MECLVKRAESGHHADGAVHIVCGSSKECRWVMGKKLMTQMAIGTGLIFGLLCLPETAWAAEVHQDLDPNLGAQDEPGETLPEEAAQSDGLEQNNSEAPQAAESSAVKTESPPEDMAEEKTDNAVETDTPNANAQEASVQEASVQETSVQGASAKEADTNEKQDNADAAKGQKTEEITNTGFVRPLITIGIGVDSMCVGAMLVIYGIAPLLHYYDVQLALQEEESRAQEDALGATHNAVLLQNLAYALNKDWKTRGFPLVAGGSLLVVAGTVFVGAGVMGVVWNQAGEGE